MKIQFTPEEKQAIVCLMELVIEADGQIDGEEINIGDDILDLFECSDEDFDLGGEMPAIVALYIVGQMESGKKQIVGDVLVELIDSDHDIADEAAIVFTMVSDLTGIRNIMDELASRID